MHPWFESAGAKYPPAPKLPDYGHCHGKLTTIGGFVTMDLRYRIAQLAYIWSIVRTPKPGNPPRLFPADIPGSGGPDQRQCWLLEISAGHIDEPIGSPE